MKKNVVDHQNVLPFQKELKKFIMLCYVTEEWKKFLLSLKFCQINLV